MLYNVNINDLLIFALIPQKLNNDNNNYNYNDHRNNIEVIKHCLRPFGNIQEVLF